MSSWPAKSTFCLRNKIFAGNPQDSSIVFLTYGSLIFFPIYFSICFIPFIMYEEWSSSIIYVFWLIFIITIYNLIFTQFKDPGILLRGQLPDPNTIEKSKPTTSELNEINLSENEIKPQNKEKKEHGLLSENYANFKYPENVMDLDIGFYKERYCPTCKIMRPPKASHCWHCDQCVKGFDHHCFFVGNCVGVRNWRNFILFIFFAFLLALMDFVVSVMVLVNIFNENPEIYEAFKNETPLLITTLVFLCLGLCCLITPFNFVLKFCIFILFLFCLVLTLALAIHNCDIDLPFYENPCYIIINIAFIFPLCFWLFILSFINCQNVLYGMTVKELSSVSKTIKYNNIRKMSYKLSCKEKCLNLYNFMTFKIPESEIFCLK